MSPLRLWMFEGESYPRFGSGGALPRHSLALNGRHEFIYYNYLLYACLKDEDLHYLKGALPKGVLWE